ncbi:MAG: RagB/SusD family nutrient uptake outer membrane protein [Balneolales bacterium]
MKYLFFLTLVLVMTFTLSACDGLLNVDPQQSLDTETVLDNSQNVESALVGAYSRMGATDGGAATLYGGPLLYLADLLGADHDELRWSGSFFPQREVWDKAIPTDNPVVTAVWTNAYNVINRVNNVISALDVVDEGIRDRVEGEARFIRGLMYFELVRFYGKAWNDGNPDSNLGVPLVLNPTSSITEENNVSRNTVSEVYAQILSDLDDAKELLPSENGYYADTYAASAILSRVHLAQGDYDDAALESSRVIEESDYALVSDYEDVYNASNNTTEDVFALQVTSQQGANELQQFYEAEDGGRGDMDILEGHLDLYEAGDARLALFDVDGDVSRSGKWTNAIDGNIHIVRLAEMYLTRAEANFREGTTVGDTPLNDVNEIRERADLDPIESLPIFDDLDLEDILHERKLELAFEGHFIHDLKRTEGSVEGLSFDANELVFPIPEREMDANPALEDQQNDGY